jgi:acetyltransferase-like isoleucine patch superfamily enzyme
MLLSYWLRSFVLGRDRALQGSTQLLAIVPGLVGQYLRRAFLAHAITGCARTAAIEFGTIFSHAGCRVGERAYIGPYCTVGFVHCEDDVIVGPGAQLLSGAHTHGAEDTGRPIRDQMMTRTQVTIGRGAWIGAGAIVMADVGANSIVGAGAVVARPIPAGVVAAGTPAKVLRSR